MVVKGEGVGCVQLFVRVVLGETKTFVVGGLSFVVAAPFSGKS